MVIQQQIDDLKGVARKASPEEERNAALALAAEAAAAAEAAGGGGGGDLAKREAEIAVAQAHLNEVRRQLKEAEAPLLAEDKAAAEVVRAETAARVREGKVYTSNISMRGIPGEGVTGVKYTPSQRRESVAREALRVVRLRWKKKLEDAQDDLNAVTAGKSYAVVLEERAAAGQSSAEWILAKKKAEEKGREESALLTARETRIEAAREWANRGVRDMLREKYGYVVSRNQGGPEDAELAEIHRQVLAIEAAGEGAVVSEVAPMLAAMEEREQKRKELSQASMAQMAAASAARDAKRAEYSKIVDAAVDAELAGKEVEYAEGIKVRKTVERGLLKAAKAWAMEANPRMLSYYNIQQITEVDLVVAHKAATGQ